MGMGTCALFALQPAQALADDCERFGSAGQVVIASTAELSLGHTTSHEIHDSQTQVVVAPSWDVFVRDGLSLGGQVGGSLNLNRAGSTHGFGFGPRIGQGVSLSEMLSFHGTLGLTYSIESNDDEAIEGLSGELFAPLLVHPAEHFFVGLGPHVSHELKKWTGDRRHPRYTSYELASVIGGYF